MDTKSFKREQWWSGVSDGDDRDDDGDGSSEKITVEQSSPAYSHMKNLLLIGFVGIVAILIGNVWVVTGYQWWNRG